MPVHKIYTFYARLNDHEPKIWRRFEIDGEKTMAEFSYFIMIMFEMQASHLFNLKIDQKKAFYRLMRYIIDPIDEEYIQKRMEDIKNARYEFAFVDLEDIYINDDEVLLNPNEHRITHEIAYPGTEVSLAYDYGDGWGVSLVLEKIESKEVSLKVIPRVLEGEGYGIVEDVGGVSGLERLAKILKKGKGKDYEFYTDWLDSTTLDLTSFDIDDINFRLKKLLRVYRDAYEYNLPPTEASLKLWNRDYLNKGSRGY